MNDESSDRANANDVATLVRRAQTGDDEAFATLVRRFQDAAVGYAWSLLGDVALAEDAAQDAFVEAWRGLSRLRAPRAFPAWLRRIVFKRADRLRRRPRRDAVPLEAAPDPDVDTPGPDTLAEREDIRRRVRAALRGLPPAQRRTVVVYYFLDRGVDGTGAFLGVPPGTVKSRLAAARAALREELLIMVDEETNRIRPSRGATFERRVQRLIRDAADGDLDGVDRILAEEPAALSEPGPHPFWGGRPTALHTAVERGRLEVVERLLGAGADPDPDSADYDGWTPLLVAATGRRDAIMRQLLEAGARPDAWVAATIGDAAMLRNLLARDPRLVNARGPNRATPLHFASTLEVARLLVDAGADLSVADQYGSTAVRTVAYSRRAERPTARWLVERSGEDDVFLRTALGDHGALSLMLDRDASLVHVHDPHLNAAAARGATPLHLAAALGDVATAALLLDRGADPNARSEPDKDTPLHYAAKFGERQLIELLLARGADPRLRDAVQDATPLDWAMFFDVQGLERLLSDGGEG